MDLYLNAEVQRLRAMVDELSAMITMTREEVMNRELNMGLDLPAQVEEAASPPHPFQIIVESATTFRVNVGILHSPGLALSGGAPDHLSLPLDTLVETTDITTIPDYDTHDHISVYIKVDYDYELNNRLAANDRRVVAVAGNALNLITGSHGGTVHFLIGTIQVTDGEIDGAPYQYIFTDYTETISGVYAEPPEE